jgi:CBS domain-containing protein
MPDRAAAFSAATADAAVAEAAMSWAYRIARVSGIDIKIHITFLPDFAVVLGGNLLGVVTRDDVLKALAQRPDDPYVAEVMERKVVRVEAADSLEEVQERMSQEKVRLVAVFSGDRFLGLVSAEDLREALSVLLFVRRQQRLALQGA